MPHPHLRNDPHDPVEKSPLELHPDLASRALVGYSQQSLSLSLFSAQTQRQDREKRLDPKSYPYHPVLPLLASPKQSNSPTTTLSLSRWTESKKKGRSGKLCLSPVPHPSAGC
jgi:hypothetical protein